MVELDTVLSFIQAAGIIVGVAYYILNIHNNQKNQQLQLETRQTQIFMQIYQQINTEEVYKSWAELVNVGKIDYEDYLKKYDSTVNPDHFAKRAQIWYSYNTIGELLRQGIIELDLLNRLSLGPMVITMWERWEHIIRKTRERERGPDLWEGFEYLYNEVKNYRDREGYPGFTYRA
jgi:hypothetical protein